MPTIFNIETGEFDEIDDTNKKGVIEINESMTAIIKGDKGDKGDKGEPGRDGIDGKSIVGPKGDIGPMGVAGKDGKDGKDAIGKDGESGEDGRGITSITQPTPETALITYTDGMTQSLNLPRGKDGREIELGRNQTHIQWRYRGDKEWHDLFVIPKSKSSGGGGIHKVKQAFDVSADNIQNGEILIWSESQKKFIPSSGGGVVTVGVSDGAFRTDDYGGNPALALAAALAVSKAVDILPGNYTWTENIEYEPDGAVDIQGRGSPNFIIAHTGAVAVADVTTLGDFNMEGIKFQINTWVASQKMVNIAPPASAFQTLNNRVKCTFVYGTGIEDDFASTFAAGNEMIGVLITQGKSCIIEGNVVYPNKGVVPGRFKNGFGNIARFNRIQNGSLFYFPSITDPQRRPCYIGIDFENETAPIHHDNVYENLGLIDNITGRVDRRLAHAVRFQIPNTPKGTYEYGHEVTRDNTFRDCLTDTTCVADYRGVRWLMMTGDYFCFNGTATAKGAGFVRITDSDADGTGTDAYSYQSQIAGCHFHNPGTSAAAAIYINSVMNLAIQSCVFHELYCTAPIVIDPLTASDNVDTLTIQGCKASWPSGTPNTRYFINRIGSDANACKKLYLDGNICASSEASQPVDGFYNGTPFATIHEVQETPIANPPIEVVRNKTYVIVQKATYSGRITEATTQCLSGTCTATFYINGVALGGTANSVSSSEQSQAHTSANEFVAGDTISMIVTSNASCLDLAYTLKAVRGLI